MNVLPARFAAMRWSDLDAVLELERQAYLHPWQRQNFVDCLNSGHEAQLLLLDDCLLGYFVAMAAVDELHLLTLVVAPKYQRQGWARLLLAQLKQLARSQNLSSILLEVRASNQRALQVYAASGFCQIGQRKQYYPLNASQREDALVLRLELGSLL